MMDGLGDDTLEREGRTVYDRVYSSCTIVYLQQMGFNRGVHP